MISQAYYKPATNKINLQQNDNKTASLETRRVLCYAAKCSTCRIVPNHSDISTDINSGI